MALALPPPPDYMGLAICATIFFFPLGVFAIHLSQKVGLLLRLLISCIQLLHNGGLEVSFPYHMGNTPHGKYTTWEIHHMGGVISIVVPSVIVLFLE